MPRETAKDRVDQLLEQWKRERPDLDASPMAILGRLTVLARISDLGVEEILRPHKLSIPEFYVLGVLRRCGPPFSQPIGKLCDHSMLSRGPMTSRADRLEKKGLVQRLPNPEDRRGVLLSLTERGLELIDVLIAERYEVAHACVSVLSKKDRRQLEALLSTFVGAHAARDHPWALSQKE